LSKVDNILTQNRDKQSLS